MRRLTTRSKSCTELDFEFRLSDFRVECILKVSLTLIAFRLKEEESCLWFFDASFQHSVLFPCLFVSASYSLSMNRGDARWRLELVR